MIQSQKNKRQSNLENKNKPRTTEKANYLQLIHQIQAMVKFSQYTELIQRVSKAKRYGQFPEIAIQMAHS